MRACVCVCIAGIINKVRRAVQSMYQQQEYQQQSHDYHPSAQYKQFPIVGPGRYSSSYSTALKQPSFTPRYNFTNNYNQSYNVKGKQKP